jgi:hypothetical protein
MLALDKTDGALMSDHGFLKSVIAFLVFVMLAAKNHSLKQYRRMTKKVMVYPEKHCGHMNVAYLGSCNSAMVLEVLHPSRPCNHVGFRNWLTIFENVSVHRLILS